MNFNQRLERAIERGTHARDSRQREAEAARLSEEECRNLHSKHRIDLSEYIANCLKKLADHFPGFRFESVIGEDGWGAKVNRDDVNITSAGRRGENQYSRLELLVSPYSSAHILELVCKGTIRNREVLNRTHYDMLSQLDAATFEEMVDLWVLEYAEAFAAQK